MKDSIAQKLHMFIVHFRHLKIEDFFFCVLVVFSLSFSAIIFQANRIDNRKVKTPQISAFEIRVGGMVKDSPMSAMTPFIAQKDKKVASYVVAIAKKESNWGKYSPKKDGKDCYNYWGYRGKENPTRSGYSCFDSPEQAVNVVGERIEELMDQQIDTPREMAVWKCGRDCSWDNPANVNKWVSDVAFYVKKLE